MVMLAQLDKELVVKVAIEAGACPKCALRCLQLTLIARMVFLLH